LNQQHWEEYYRHGSIAAYPPSAELDCDAQVHQAWIEFFSAYPDGARILDIGTGNGIVAMIARETAVDLGRTWDIHGIDLAQINPLKHVTAAEQRLAGITFHAGIAAESLPFEDGSIDAVCGQYALEHMDITRVLAEVHRVLKPDGRAQFIIQHAGSWLVRNAQVSLKEADFILRELKIYRRLAKLVARENTTTARVARNAGTDLRQAIQIIKREQPKAQASGGGVVFHYTLEAVQKLLQLRTKYPPNAVEKEIELAEANLRAWVRRLNDLDGNARDENGMHGIEQAAAAASLHVKERVALQHSRTGLVDWRLLLQPG
jgi:ubiquinone/menaquinone biosynthesis C-methylase UbiE